MTTTVKIGIIGDWDPAKPSHPATNDALNHAAAAMGLSVEPLWIPTENFNAEQGRAALDGCQGVWCSPGSPYKSFDGALWGIRFARENLRPFIGT